MPETTEFLPFHAINEFMRPDFRLTVIRETLIAQSTLPGTMADDLNHQIKKRVTIPGFRNSDKAPALVKVLPTSKSFEKYPELVAVILACWAEYQNELRDQVFTLLKSRGWKILKEDDNIDFNIFSQEFIKTWPVLPINFNRTKLPGFYTHWPKSENFEVLYSNFSDIFPNSNVSMDKVSLMVVWLSMRLPYQQDDYDDRQYE